MGLFLHNKLQKHLFPSLVIWMKHRLDLTCKLFGTHVHLSNVCTQGDTTSENFSEESSIVIKLF